MPDVNYRFARIVQVDSKEKTLSGSKNNQIKKGNGSIVDPIKGSYSGMVFLLGIYERLNSKKRGKTDKNVNIWRFYYEKRGFIDA